MNKDFTSTNFTRLFALFFMLLAFSNGVFAASFYFYVQFADKNNSPYSLSNPSEYLSSRAVERRTNLMLSIDSTDLPVNPSYVQQINDLGVAVHCKSKWMNGVTVLLTDSSVMSQVRELSFVKFVQYTGFVATPASAPAKRVNENTNIDYGVADAQISQLSGKYLHNLGFRGKGIHIGVIDAGFYNVDVNPAFDSLRLQGRLLGTRDIINPNSNIYAEDSHGAAVLSTMAGNKPDEYLGTAPDASYWLIRTEYAPTEYKVETDFWVSGIEFADSVGVDVVNSSLGYYTFDDPTTSFSYADMTGKVSRASRAATLASKKGIIVVVSAGNEGNKTWHYIGTPADAEGIVTVGAVTIDSTSSYFSSFGPSYDGRVKPEICAIGTSSAVLNSVGSTSYSNGTSFSSPIMAGMMACFLQASKSIESSFNIDTLLYAVYQSAHLYKTPTAQKGYGIPNFENAFKYLKTTSSISEPESNLSFKYFYNNQFKKILIWPAQNNTMLDKTIKIYSITGSLMYTKKITNTLSEISVANFPRGIYALNISGAQSFETIKLLIN